MELLNSRAGGGGLGTNIVITVISKLGSRDLQGGLGKALWTPIYSRSLEVASFSSLLP